MKKLVLLLLFLTIAAPASWAKPAVTAARIGQHPEMTRFVMELSEPPAYRIFTLPDPFRVVIDLPEVDWHLPRTWRPRKAGAIVDLRFGLFAQGTSRVVLDVKSPVKVGGVQMLPPSGRYPSYRLVVDLRSVSRQAFFADERRPHLSASPLPSVKAPGMPSLPARNAADQRPTVVIDAGHGGVDPGATGISGIHEKQVVMAYARELERQLLATGQYRVVLTRKTDVVLPLRTRIEVAHEAEGDLFISLHADSHRKRSIKGASVYTLSERASDAEAEALATKENKADILVGVNLQAQTQDVSKILIDLAQRETMNRSKNFASILVSELRKSVRLLAKTHRFAGFAVLKSPTVPSVLIEIGYLSNPADEKLLRTKGHRRKVAQSIRRAIDRYFKWSKEVSRS